MKRMLASIIMLFGVSVVFAQTTVNLNYAQIIKNGLIWQKVKFEEKNINGRNLISVHYGTSMDYGDEQGTQYVYIQGFDNNYMGWGDSVWITLKTPIYMFDKDDDQVEANRIIMENLSNISSSNHSFNVRFEKGTSSSSAVVFLAMNFDVSNYNNQGLINALEYLAEWGDIMDKHLDEFDEF